MRPLEVVRLALSGGRSDRLRIVLTALGTAAAALLLMAAVNVIDIRTLGTPGPPPGTVAVTFDDGMLFVGSPSDFDELVGRLAEDRGVPVEEVLYRDYDAGLDASRFNSYYRYGNALLDEPGLHVGIVATALALLVPLVLFVGQCARIGAPNRDRRLAAFRMAGATPRQAALVAVAESSLAAVAGAVFGVAAFAALRALDPQTPNAAGRLRWPSDIAIPPWQYAIVAAALPALVAVGTRIALRKVSISPFGVLRRRPTDAPAVLPALLFALGIATLTGIDTVVRFVGEPGEWVLVVAFTGLVLVVVGLSAGSAAISQKLGRSMLRTTSSPAVLLAGRRADHSPFQTSRPAAAVLLAALMASAVAQTRVNFLAATDPGDTLYASTFDLLNLVLAIGMTLSVAGLAVVATESVVTRRRTLAALVASGTPRATLGRSVLIESSIAIVPLTPIAAAAGTFASRTLFGTTVDNNGREISVAIPWASLSVIAFGTILAALAVAAIGLLFLPASTSPTELRTA